MKIGMQTWGSHGDIRPFLALAEGLQAAGHEVHLVLTCVAGDGYRSGVAPSGLRVSVLASPVVTADQEQAMGRRAYRTRNPTRQMQAILRKGFDPVEDVMFAAAQDLCADADLLIGHFLLHPLQVAAEHAGRPYVSIVLSHVTLPSAFHNPMGLPLGPAGNRLLWRLTAALLNRALLHYPNRLRRQLGMAPVRDLLREVWASPWLTLAAISPRLCEAQPDWPSAVRLCGFLDMPVLAMEGSVPAALADFLAAGEAPVYMTLGSWMPQDSEGQAATLRLLTQAARKAGCRAIIQSHDAGACGFTSGDGILYVAMAPHQAIFPYCRAIVHHGGAGTTQAAALAGKPSIVVAHIGEQEHWAIELRRVGIGVRRLHRRSVTPASLARRIRQACAAPQMAQRAAQIGAAMRQEDGVAEAVRLIAARFGAHLPAGEAAALIP